MNIEVVVLGSPPLNSHRGLCGRKATVNVCTSERQRVLKFRLCNHRLPIQQRRSLGIPRDERIGTVCDSGEVGDEFHYLLTVPMKMSRETVLSMLINIIHIIPTCPHFVAS